VSKHDDWGKTNWRGTDVDFRKYKNPCSVTWGEVNERLDCTFKVKANEPAGPIGVSHRSAPGGPGRTSLPSEHRRCATGKASWSATRSIIPATSLWGTQCRGGNICEMTLGLITESNGEIINFEYGSRLETYPQLCPGTKNKGRGRMVSGVTPFFAFAERATPLTLFSQTLLPPRLGARRGSCFVLHFRN